MYKRKFSYKEEREKAVARLISEGHLRSPEIIQAMRRVPREDFLPEHLRERAYLDTPLPIGYGQTISALHMVAIMVEYLNLAKGQVILEVGCGSGYHAAVVAEVVVQSTNGVRGHVYTFEIVPELVKFARENLRKTNYDKWVTLIHGDGSLGYSECAPFDRILVTAAAPSLPPVLLDQLKEGGILVIPVGDLYLFQELLRVRKDSGEIRTEQLGGVAFVPLRGKHGWKV